MKDEIFAIVFLFIFTYAEYVFIKRYLNTKSWKMECCNYGKVIEKYIMPRNNSRERHIIVNVNGNDIKIKSENEEYRLLDINDEVIVFSIEGHDKAYVTKNDNN